MKVKNEMLLTRGHVFNSTEGSFIASVIGSFRRETRDRDHGEKLMVEVGGDKDATTEVEPIY